MAAAMPSEPAWILLAAPSARVHAAVAAFWLLASAAAFTRLALALSHVRRLQRDAGEPIAGRDLPLWRGAAAGRHVELRASDDVALPCVLGYRRPMILVPRELLRRLDDEELDLVLLHEYGHVVRHDVWSRLAQAFAEAVAPLHPAVWWIGRQLELEREAACDDLVLARIGSPRRYATCLADAAEVARASRATVPVLGAGMLRAPSMLRCRVRRVLDSRRCRRVRAARLPLAAHLTLVAGVIATVAAAGPVVGVASGRSPVDQASVVTPSPHVPSVGSKAPAQVVASTRGVTSATIMASTPEAADGSPARRTSGPAGASSGTRVSADATPGGPGGERAANTTAVPSATPQEAVVSAAAVPVPASAGPENTPDPFSALPSRPVVTELRDGAEANPPGVAGERSPWRRLADAGSATGSGTARAGTAVARFFVRGGRTLAGAVDR
jgi:beta-lactamase regulating signal transducer with metallopeptidase domain